MPERISRSAIGPIGHSHFPSPDVKLQQIRSVEKPVEKAKRKKEEVCRREERQGRKRGLYQSGTGIVTPRHQIIAALLRPDIPPYSTSTTWILSRIETSENYLAWRLPTSFLPSQLTMKQLRSTPAHDKSRGGGNLRLFLQRDTSETLL